MKIWGFQLLQPWNFGVKWSQGVDLVRLVTYVRVQSGLIQTILIVNDRDDNKYLHNHNDNTDHRKGGSGSGKNNT